MGIRILDPSRVQTIKESILVSKDYRVSGALILLSTSSMAEICCTSTAHAAIYTYIYVMTFRAQLATFTAQLTRGALLNTNINPRCGYIYIYIYW